MQLGPDTRIENGMLAPIALRNEKPRLGGRSKNPAPYPGIDACNSTTALGLQPTATLNRVGSRSPGKERDTESGNDYFLARYYNSNTGRFLSPDWDAKSSDPVPYAKLDNPQSLNLYSYVGNNPMDKVDADGHQEEDAADEALDKIESVREENALRPVEPAPAITPLTPLQQAASNLLYDTPVERAIESEVDRQAGGEPPQLAAGKEAHSNEEIRPGEKAEVPTPSGTGRMDRYNSDTAHIREIKPDNPRGEKSGNKQLGRYKDEMEKATGRPHTTELTKYKPKTKDKLKPTDAP